MPTPLKSSVILLADDLETDVLLVQRAFVKAKIANPLKVVCDGEQVLSYLKGEGEYGNREKFPLPSLLLLDLKMPRMNGLEVLSWVRAEPTFKALPIVMLTASREPEDLKRAYQLGADGFLVKPTDFNELVLVMQALQGTWMWTSEVPEMRSSAIRSFSLSRSGPGVPRWG